jgi:hypothetical protein
MCSNAASSARLNLAMAPPVPLILEALIYGEQGEEIRSLEVVPRLGQTRLVRPQARRQERQHAEGW